ncbi:hypothetical protein [Streptomyces griseorubiginosus]
MSRMTFQASQLLGRLVRPYAELARQLEVGPGLPLSPISRANASVLAP